MRWDITQPQHLLAQCVQRSAKCVHRPLFAQVAPLGIGLALQPAQPAHLLACHAILQGRTAFPAKLGTISTEMLVMPARL